MPATNTPLARSIDAMLEAGKTPFAAVVVLEASTGKIIAVSEHSTKGQADGLATRPMAKAASVFKIVTTAALLDDGVRSDASVCFHGGRTRMTAALLADDRRRDNQCTTLNTALSHSQNVAVAKLASKHLSSTALSNMAKSFQFGADIDLPGFEPSHATIPSSPFAFAEAAAGFGDVKISAMHGAVIASIVANDGVYIPPTADGSGLSSAKRVLPRAVASSLQDMLADTVSEGTARRAFHQQPRMTETAAGKTGSLTDYQTKLDTSWFVGYAPADNPRYVVAAVVVNDLIWHIKAPQIAKEALRLAMQQESKAATTRVAHR
jgi:penicillin-binding protein A